MENKPVDSGSNSRNKKKKTILLLVLLAYMVLCPFIAVYLLFFAEIDFLLKAVLIVLSGGVLIALAVLNLLAR